MTIAEQHAAALAQRLAWRGVTQTHLDHLDALHADRHDRARADEIAQTWATLDDDDLNNGRAPRADNADVAARLTDRAIAQRKARL